MAGRGRDEVQAVTGVVVEGGEHLPGGEAYRVGDGRNRVSNEFDLFHHLGTQDLRYLGLGILGTGIDDINIMK